MVFTHIISLNDFLEFLSPDDALFRSSPMTSNKICLQNNKLINGLWILMINTWIKITDNSLGTRFADMACEEELQIPASFCHFYFDLHVDSNIFHIF